MTSLQIFGLQFILSVIVFALLAKWYVAPRLAALPLHDALLLLVIPHAFRHLGLVFLLPTVVGSTLPVAFAVPTAYGDLVTGGAALVALVALRRRWAGAVGLVWLVNVVGTLDFLYGFYQGMRFQVALGAAYFIPVVANPAMYVSHAMIFAMLFKRSLGRKPGRPLPETRQ